MSDDDITAFRLDALERFSKEQNEVNKSLLDGIAQLKEMLVVGNARSCGKPNHCLFLDTDLQNHKLAFHERASRIEEQLRTNELWKTSIDNQLTDLKALLNKGMGIISFFCLVAAPLIVWGLGHWFPAK